MCYWIIEIVEILILNEHVNVYNVYSVQYVYNLFFNYKYLKGLYALLIL